MKSLIVFGAMFALDLVWVKYTHATVANQAVKAGFYASGIMLLNGTVVLGYTTDPWMLIPAILGAFAGTIVAIRWRK